MALCPKCKEELPLLSKICPVCGTVVEQKNEELGNMIGDMQTLLMELKSLPKRGLMSGMQKLAFITLPLIALFMLVMAVISESGLFWILFVLFAISGVIAVVKKGRGVTASDLDNRLFNGYKNNYQKFQSLASIYYGKSKEVTNVLKQMESEIADIENRRKSDNNRTIIVWGAILIVLFVGAILLVTRVNDKLNGSDSITNLPFPEQITKLIEGNHYDEAIELYTGSQYNDEHAGEEYREQIVGALLKGDAFEKVNQFFTQNCMGKKGDFKCAEMILKSYVAKPDMDGAKLFLDGCKLRYESDMKKLKLILNQ